MSVSVGGILMVAWLAVRLYHGGKHVPVGDENSSSAGFMHWVRQKFYIDEIYDWLITRPAFFLAGFLSFFVDRKVIDGFVEGMGGTSQFLASKWRETQNGFISYYLFAMALGMLGILVIYIVL
jgi:NADH-quinone oxidoreductase subunit L